MMKKRLLVFGAALMTCVAFAGPSLGQTSTNLSDFPLSKAAPSDVFIAVMAKHNPEREFLDAYWAEVWDAFHQSGLMEDVWDLLTEDVSDEELDAIEEAREQFSKLIAAINWGELFKKEMLYTARISNRLEPPSPYEGLLIGRMSNKLAEQNHKSLKSLLQGLSDAASMRTGDAGKSEDDDSMLQDTPSGDGDAVEKTRSKSKKTVKRQGGFLVVGECTIEGIPMTTFGVGDAPQLICIGHKDDLLIISLFNRTLLQDSLKLMRGRGDGGLIKSGKFKKAIADLPPAEDSILYFNMGNMMGQIKEMISSAVPPPPAGSSPAEENGYDESVAGVKAVVTLIDDINMFDYIVSVEWTEGYRVFSETITQLDSDSAGKPLYKVLKGGAPIEDFAKYIPKETTDFWCTTGVDFAALYRYAINFVETKVPTGRQAVASFKEMQAKDWNLDIEKDVLSLLEGNIQTITAGNNTVIMMKVTNVEKLDAQLDRLFTWISERLGEEAGSMISETEVAGRPGFRQIRHPVLMMMGGGMMPVIGTADGYLFFSTSDRFLTKCLDTASGKHPNITENKRWQAEALARKNGGPVDSIKFADETRMGEELQAGVNMLSAALGFMNMARGESGFPPELRDTLSTISPMLTKLGVVLGHLDFYQSSSAYTVSDGMMWHAYSVQNYKKPSPKTPASESEEDDSEDAEDSASL